MFVLHNYLGLTTQLVNPDARVELHDIESYKISQIKETLLRQQRSSVGNMANSPNNDSLSHSNPVLDSVLKNIIYQLKTFINLNNSRNMEVFGKWKYFSRHIINLGENESVAE